MCEFSPFFAAKVAAKILKFSIPDPFINADDISKFEQNRPSSSVFMTFFVGISADCTHSTAIAHFRHF